MNPRNVGNFFKSKFGLFVVFLVVLFSGLWLYGRHQAKDNARTIRYDGIYDAREEGLENLHMAMQEDGKKEGRRVVDLCDGNSAVAGPFGAGHGSR